MNTRFTIDGGGELESHLGETCQKVLAGVQKLIPPAGLEALILGGGYGRGEGGVLKSDSGERPYNDMEFYVFIRGNALLTEPKYRAMLRDLGEQLSPGAGLHVEFKVYSADKLRQSPVSMFTYDLAAGHKSLFGGEGIFEANRHHHDAEKIPASEATRLLFNRCSGLLLAKNFLRERPPSAEHQDFIGRNIAKAQLAFGDAILAIYGKYHWSCLERARRLATLFAPDAPSWLDEVRAHHATGVEFKLHPRRSSEPKEALMEQHFQTANIGRKLWLWAESRRLSHLFASAKDYATSTNSKCPETKPWRNFLLNLRTFGAEECFGSLSFRYPRERLMDSLCLLLWGDSVTSDPAIQVHLKRILHARSGDWEDLIQAYQRIWEQYG